MLDDYKITDAEQKALGAVVDKVNNESIYSEFVTLQEKGFMRVMEFVNTTIFFLKEDCFVSFDCRITARIKDFESAMKNYETDKMLDDIFGIEIICKNEEELDTIKTILEKMMITTKTKKFNKSNGYKAQHESYFPNSKSETAIRWKICNENVPIVEFQFKTIEVALNEKASHHGYKKRDQKAIIEMLKNKVLEKGKQLPRMWISTDGLIRELEYEEVIQKIYPFVDIATIKKPEPKIK